LVAKTLSRGRKKRERAGGRLVSIQRPSRPAWTGIAKNSFLNSATYTRKAGGRVTTLKRGGKPRFNPKKTHRNRYKENNEVSDTKSENEGT